MKQFLYKHKGCFVYGLISILALVWNIVTMGHSIPWCDEVMLADTPANMHIYGEWATTAFNAMGEGSKPFSVYLPLYTWLLYVWISIFGFSFLKVRLCEMITTVVLGGFLLRLGGQLAGKKLSLLSIALFSLGFWFTDLMVMIYRMARPDILGALMTVVFAIYVVKNLKEQKKYTWQLMLFSGLSIVAGIQSALYVVLGLIFTALFVRPVKRMLHPALCCLVGFVLGFIIVVAYMACFGEAKAFIVSIMNSSGAVMKLWEIARGIIFPLLGKEVTPLGYPEASPVPFYVKLLDIFAYTGAIILFVVNALLLILHKAWHHVKAYKMPILVFFFSIFTILGYNLAGRYQGYYMWTAILPMLLSLLIWMNVGKRLFAMPLVGISAIVMLGMALNRFPLTGESSTERIAAFVNQQHFKKTDRIAAPFSTFYALKPTNQNTYFYQIYPQNLIGEVDYVIIPEAGDDYNQEGMEKFLKDLQHNPKYQVEKISRLQESNLALYKVCSKTNQ